VKLEQRSFIGVASASDTSQCSNDYSPDLPVKHRRVSYSPESPVKLKIVSVMGRLALGVKVKNVVAALVVVSPPYSPDLPVKLAQPSFIGVAGETR
jgi:hypothetical protein